MHRFGTWKTDPASPPMSRINVPLTTTTLFMPMLFVCTDPPSLSIRPSHSGAASNKGSAPLGFCCNILNLLHETYFGEGVPSLQIEIQSTMGRSPCCEKVGLKKGPWTPEEDQKLLSYIEKHGHGSWRALPSKAGLQRCGKSCRLRWTNYLRPDIKRGEFSLQEEQTIIQLHALLGNRWSSIATHLPKRTDNEIKNYWNTHLKKRLAKMGIDPCTHKAKSDTLSSVDGHPRSAANLSHMAQWESARLEAEARLVRESKLRTTASTSAILPGSSSSSSSTTPGCIDVLRAWQAAWPTKPLPTQGEKIDHESPTSTLTFTENRLAFPATVGSGLVDGDGTAFSYQEGDNLEALAPWLPEACTVQEACTLGQFGAGFTGMLLRGKNSDCCGDSFGDDHEKCAREEGEEQGREEFMDGEENNYYWNSILNSVNSSSSSSSPSVFYN